MDLSTLRCSQWVWSLLTLYQDLANLKCISEEFLDIILLYF